MELALTSALETHLLVVSTVMTSDYSCLSYTLIASGPDPLSKKADRFAVHKVQPLLGIKPYALISRVTV
jgi:hypothetical protein